MPARSFRYVNTSLATSLAADMGIDLKASRSQEVRAGVNAGITAEVKLGRSSGAAASSDPRVLDRIVRGLRKSRQLRDARPERSRDFWHEPHDGWYVAEKFIATPVTLPPGVSSSVDRELTVWVGEPTGSGDELGDAWDARGTFVFLVEELASFDWTLGHAISGVSSLRLVVEVVGSSMIGGDVLAFARTPDRFSELVDADPVDKLEAIGGIVGSPRPIETVYKIAYMNDEQCWRRQSTFLRTNDLLAYPLFIVSR